MTPSEHVQRLVREAVDAEREECAITAFNALIDMPNETRMKAAAMEAMEKIRQRAAPKDGGSDEAE